MARGLDLLRWLGVDRAAQYPEVLDAISGVLDRLDERRARYIAAFAYCSDASPPRTTRWATKKSG